ncbi:MAG: hypothetical protein JEZ06_22855 [Anaerolineaceae bacterium]|nr:hypothetical protein [Anaerolineaceae bacterium]
MAKSPIDQDISFVIGVRKKNGERSNAYDRRGEIAVLHSLSVIASLRSDLAPVSKAVWGSHE